MLYFAYYPIQTVEAFGGLDLSDVPAVLRDGVRCTLGMPPLSQAQDSPMKLHFSLRRMPRRFFIPLIIL